MPQVSPARKKAFETLLQVEAGRGFAADLLEAPEVSALSEVDRALSTEIVLGVLRWRGEIDYRLNRVSGKNIGSFEPEVAAALRMGFYQIGFLEKIPKSAAVNESVELIKLARKPSAAGLVNAVLRKCEPPPFRAKLRSPDGLSDDAWESVQHAVPAWLLERWQRHFGRQTAAALAWASVQIPSLTVRAAALHQDPAAIRKELEARGMEVRAGRYAEGALMIERGKGVNAQLCRDLKLAVQDEASQIVPALLAVRPGMRVLDLCAAPGMKTSLLAQELQRGMLLACDVSRTRLRKMQKLLPSLTANLQPLQLVQLDATEELPFRQGFGRILVDAPCSGTGTLARNPEIKWRLQPQDLQRLPEKQAAILKNALRWLEAGGRLVYATCSLEPEENEGVVESVVPTFPDCRLLSHRELAEEFPRFQPLFDSRGYFHTRPDRDRMDAFFAAVIIR